jgi:hypothetical protein
MRAKGRIALLLAGLAAAAGCDGASPETGITANLRLSTGQFVPGPITPDTTAMGPTVFVNLGVAKVAPGVQNLPLSGNVQAGSSVLIGLADDAGHWIVPAPIRDVTEENSFQFSTRMAFSPLLPQGTQTLIVRGVAPDGTIGPSQQFALTVTSPVPTGALVFSLSWDTQADLDLHVLVPNPEPDPMTGGPGAPIEIWSRNQVGVPPTSVPRSAAEMQAAVKAAGRLDFDSNSNCAIDGRRQENVIFPAPPPDGEYIVRVDTFSLCGQATAQWRVDVTDPNGAVVNPATWQSIDADTRGPHGLGAGRLALQFTLPL